MTAPRLLVVTVDAPHKSRGAGLVLFWHYLDGVRRAGWHVRHIAIGTAAAAGSEFALSIAEPGVFEVEAFEASAPIRESLRGLSIDRRAIAPALARARAFVPDVILAFDIHAAWAFEEVESPARVVWAGDLMFDITRYHALYAAREDWRRWPHSMLRLIVARNWLPVYRRVLGAASFVVASSISSVAKLAKLGVSSEFQPYPWPDPGRVSRLRPPAKPTFVFFGNLSALGSRSALHFALDEVVPRLRRIWGAGGFELRFAGTGKLPGWAQSAFARAPEAKSYGFVDDLSGFVAQSHGVIAPIDVPVGNRTRILTALAYCVPVIAHRNAALGNPSLVDGETCFLAANPKDFVERMAICVADPERAARIAEGGRRAYERDYAPESVWPLLNATLERFKPAEPAGRAALSIGAISGSAPSDKDRR